MNVLKPRAEVDLAQSGYYILVCIFMASTPREGLGHYGEVLRVSKFK